MLSRCQLGCASTGAARLKHTIVHRIRWIHSDITIKRQNSCTNDSCQILCSRVAFGPTSKATEPAINCRDGESCRNRKSNSRNNCLTTRMTFKLVHTPTSYLIGSHRAVAVNLAHAGRAKEVLARERQCLSSRLNPQPLGPAKPPPSITPSASDNPPQRSCSVPGCWQYISVSSGPLPHYRGALPQLAGAVSRRKCLNYPLV